MWNMWTNSMHDILARIAYVCISWKSKKNEFYYEKIAQAMSLIQFEIKPFKCKIWSVKAHIALIHVRRNHKVAKLRKPFEHDKVPDNNDQRFPIYVVHKKFYILRYLKKQFLKCRLSMTFWAESTVKCVRKDSKQNLY